MAHDCAYLWACCLAIETTTGIVDWAPWVKSNCWFTKKKVLLGHSQTHLVMYFLCDFSAKKWTSMTESAKPKIFTLLAPYRKSLTTPGMNHGSPCKNLKAYGGDLRCFCAQHCQRPWKPDRLAGRPSCSLQDLAAATASCLCLTATGPGGSIMQKCRKRGISGKQKWCRELAERKLSCGLFHPSQLSSVFVKRLFFFQLLHCLKRSQLKVR